MERWWNIRKATSEDKNAILKIAHQYRTELGYVHPVGLMGHITKGTVHVAERGGVMLGFVDFHQPKRGDNAGFSVVYHIATDKRQKMQGVGRALLYSVPCPIRLKCTEENPANKFYEHAGMFKTHTDTGKKRALHTWQLNVLSVLVAGNNKRFPEMALKTGMAYGVRSDFTAHDWPFMVDIHWKKYDWKEYLQKVADYRPIQAMVADYEHSEQRELMLSQVQDLRDLGIMRIMVCPKFDNAIRDIPQDCVIAVSVPSKYAGYLPNLHDLAGRQVHLLGGSPKKQGDLIKKMLGVGANVLSIDGNTHTNPRQANMIFTDGQWRSLGTQQMDYYDKIIISGQGITRHINNEASMKQLALV